MRSYLEEVITALRHVECADMSTPETKQKTGFHRFSSEFVTVCHACPGLRPAVRARAASPMNLLASSWRSHGSKEPKQRAGPPLS